MNKEIDESIFRSCQIMGYSHNLIIQAWIDCKGNEELLLDTLFHLSRERQVMQMMQKAKYPKIKIIPKSTLLKKLPWRHHLELNFGGRTALEFLELRKLGIFSKKVFRNIKGLSLGYFPDSSYYRDRIGDLQNKHVSAFANHMNRGLRKLNNLSITLESAFSRPGVNMIPLLKSIKQSFVCLVSLKLALRGDFRSSKWELFGFERLFARIRSTLKHLDLNFTRNPKRDESFSEDLGMIIMNRLQKLKTLCLNFNSTNISTRIVRLLISGACTHLTSLNSLTLNVEKCHFTKNDWSSYPSHNLTNNLQDLKLNIDSCQGLRSDFLWALQNDIVGLCPELKKLFLSAQGYNKLLGGFDSAFERGFLERLRLKRFEFLYSNDFENTWRAYQKTQALEFAKATKMEEEFEKVRQWSRGEEDIHLYYETLIEEKQAPTKHEYRFGENEYLENNFENRFLEKEAIEEEAQDEIGQMVQEYDDDSDFFERWEMEEEILREGEGK